MSSAHGFWIQWMKNKNMNHSNCDIDTVLKEVMESKGKGHSIGTGTNNCFQAWQTISFNTVWKWFENIFIGLMGMLCRQQFSYRTKVSSTIRRLDENNPTTGTKLLCFAGLTSNLSLLTTDDPIDRNTLNAAQLKLMNSHEIRWVLSPVMMNILDEIISNSLSKEATMWWWANFVNRLHQSWVCAKLLWSVGTKSKTVEMNKTFSVEEIGWPR